MTNKLSQLDQYDEALERIQDLKCGVDSGGITAEEFVEAVTTLLMR